MMARFRGAHDPALHVWAIPLQASPGVIQTLRELISADEAAVAERMRVPELRTAFIISHGILRVLLSRYLEKSPEEICFRESSKGKPSVFPPQPLQFNLSHSGMCALAGFAIGCEIGVDVEQVRTFSDMEAVAARFFCPDEVKDLARLSPQLREQAFFRCWTRKEAYLKATGEGLSSRLDDFQVSLCPDKPACFLRLPSGSGSWSLYDIKAGTGYAAALAHRGPERPLKVTTIEEISPLIEGLEARSFR